MHELVIVCDGTRHGPGGCLKWLLLCVMSEIRSKYGILLQYNKETATSYIEKTKLLAETFGKEITSLEYIPTADRQSKSNTIAQYTEITKKCCKQQFSKEEFKFDLNSIGNPNKWA